MKRILILLVLTALTISLHAQKKWTLRECVDYAIANNITVKQIQLEVENADINLNTSRNSRLPNLTASVGQSFNFGQAEVWKTGTDENNQEVRSIVYENTQTSSTSFSANSSVPVFSGMRISNQIKSNELQLKAVIEGLSKAMENLELEVASLYFEALYKKEILDVYHQQVSLTEEQTERTRALVETGKASVTQLYEIEAKLERDRLNAVTAANDLDLAILNIAQVLSIADPAGFDIIDPDKQMDAVTTSSLRYSPSEIYEMALGIKPHIKEAELRVKGGEQDIKVTRADFWPTLNMGLSYNNGFNHVFGSSNESMRRQLKKRGNEYVGLNLSIPIFNRLATRNRVRSAQLRVDDYKLQLDNVKLAVYKEIRIAHQGAVASLAKMSASSKAFESASKAYEFTQESYSVGRSTVYELSEAQMKMRDSESELLRAKYELVFRSKILDFYMGIPIEL